MLVINGELGGKIYDHQKVSTKEFQELFGIDFGDKDMVAFKTSGRRMVTDRFKQKKTPKGFYVVSNTSGTINGAQVEIIYATSSKKVGLETVYSPRNVVVPGGTMSISATQKTELALFLHVHHKSESSPFEGKNEKYFGFLDTQKEAVQKLSPHLVMKSIYDMVFDENMDEELLLSKAAGIGLSVHKRSMEEVQAALLDVARGNPDDFIKNYQRSTTTLTGLVTRAMNHGIISSRRSGAGAIYEVTGTQASTIFGSNPYHLVTVDFGASGAKEEIVMFLAKNQELVSKLATAVRNFGKVEGIEIDESLMSSTSKAPLPPDVPAEEE